ncbi:C2 domain-containing protein [Stachybotrys elegans]|uniref:C2 domain-containing protein n=1 Tax=Stachybotrys elegans TaxID=80388 RepID=A0A8K0WX20_9HYPO|nr:C2 domain-containing protein [Stachybotrys elegans]
MAFCGTYYRTSLRRVRRNFRDDITRELALKRLDTEVESLDWINSFLYKFWPIYQPVLADTIINTVDQVLSSATPGFLDSLKLKKFTLGSKPPRMEHVKTHPKDEDDIVTMDWKFSFTPNDTTDMTQKQFRNKINPKVVLEIRIGKAMISKGLDVIVEDMSFSGIMRLKIKLQLPFPHIEKIEMSFLERPHIDYVCKPLGGDNFGFDINFIPGLESFILEQIHGNLSPMMYWPNIFPIEVAKMLAGTPLDQALGVVALTLHGARGLKNSDNFGGTVDPYASISFNRRKELARTKTIEDDPNPRWNETHYLIVTSMHDSLDIQVFDKNDFRKSKELGVASFQLEKLEDVTQYENEQIEVIADGKARGVVSCDIRFFPVLEPTKVDGKDVPPPESNQGILRFTVEQAKDLDGTRSMVGSLNPYAILFLNGKEIHQTKKLKRTNKPIWDNGSKEILITDRKKAKLGVTIKDDRDIAGDQTVGKYQIKLDQMLECMEQGKEWYHLAGAKTGRVKMMAQWKPVAITGVAGSGGYLTPIGVMRFHLKKATDLRNFEAFGKSDPYTRVLLSGIEKARTVTFSNDLNPTWDEVLYVPIHSARDKLVLEVMDSEKMGKDRSLGSIELFAGDFVRQAEDGEYLVHDKKTVREDGLRLHGKGIVKGSLTYTASFYPCLNVADPEDEESEEQQRKSESVNGDAEWQPRTSSERSSQAGKFKASLDRLEVTKEPLSPMSPTSPTTTVGRASTTGRPSIEEPSGPPKIRLSPQELLRYESGLLIFRLMEAEMPDTHSRLEVLVDDMAFPSYSTSVARNRNHKFDEIGDCVIRELEFSRLTVRARKKGDDKDDILSSLSGNTLETLKQCLNNPTTLKLKGERGENGGWVKVSLKYLPLKMDLDPSESINNMGKLRVDVLDAQDLPSADRNGKSDPFCRFELEGQEVYKTKVQKKTLHPAWNEFFEVDIPSRTAADFKVTVWDYDFADKPDFLGATEINLESLDPFRASETSYILDGKSGTIRLRLLFRPDYITRARQGTSTFATFSGTFAAPGRIVTGVAGVPLKGGAVVAGAVGHGVGKGASFLRRGLFGKKDGEDGTNGSLPEVAEVPTITETPEVTNGSIKRSFSGLNGHLDVTKERPKTSHANNNSSPASHIRTKSFGSQSAHHASATASGPSPGTATFTVIEAEGFPASADLYVMITQVAPREKVVGKTKHFKSSTGEWTFEETFKFPCSPDAQFKVEARGEHLFGSDDELGEQMYVVDDSNSGLPKALNVGGGFVTIKSSFQPAESSLAPDSPRSTVRRSFLSKRETRGSRETTPNP